MPSRRFVVFSLGAAGAVAAAGLLPGAGTPEGDEDDLSAAPGLPSRTRGFVALSGRLPWVADLGRTCGRVATLRDGLVGVGSCVLLDEFGTLALTAHQVEDWPVAGPDGGRRVEAIVGFSPVPGQWVEQRATVPLHFHPQLDLALGRLDPALVRDAGLAPVVWGALPPYVPGIEVTALGWAFGRDRLHAAAGPCRGFIDIDREEYTSPAQAGRVGEFLCKVEASLVAHGGMSGGGVFRNGAFVGMGNANGPADDVPRQRFTPSWAVWQAYAARFPERAAAARFAPGPRPDSVPLPLSCRPVVGWVATAE